VLLSAGWFGVAVAAAERPPEGGGTMVIEITGGEHRYELTYTLPTGP
jgi:hypothetical protein